MNSRYFKLIRLYHDLSQRQFAEKLGTSLTTVCEIESDTRGISANIRSAIAKNFSIDDGFLKFAESYTKIETITNVKRGGSDQDA